MHDFVIPELRARARRAPYGIYDLAQNTGWVSVGITDHDAHGFVCGVETIRRWWCTPWARRDTRKANGC